MTKHFTPSFYLEIPSLKQLSLLDRQISFVLSRQTSFLLLLPTLLFKAFFFFQVKQVRNNYIIFMTCTTSNHKLFLLFSTPSLFQHFCNSATGMIRKLQIQFSCTRTTFPTSCSQDFAFLFNSCHKLCNSSPKYSKAPLFQIILNFATLQCRGTILAFALILQSLLCSAEGPGGCSNTQNLQASPGATTTLPAVQHHD